MKYISCVVMLLFLSCMHKTPASDSWEYRKKVRQFFKWYVENKKNLDTIDIVEIPLGDSIYRVNFNKVSEYMFKLERSGMFSKKYLRDKSANFIRLDSNLYKAKQKDGPAEGFEADMLLHTQELDNMLEDTRKFKYSEFENKNRLEIQVNWFGEIRVFILDTTVNLIDSIYVK